MINSKPISNPSQKEWSIAPLRVCDIFIFTLLLSFSTTLFSQKKYKKVYYKNGNLKTEGWTIKNTKIDYWKSYYKNGNLKEEGRYKNGKKIKYWYFYTQNSTIEKEGHFKEGNKNNWWLFYDKNGNINHKCQLKDNQKNGYCLIYRKQKIVKASKFAAGKKIKEWTDLSSFREENSLNDLR